MFHKKLDKEWQIHYFNIEYLSVIYPEPIASHVFHICHIMSRERCILRIQMHHNGIEQVKWRNVALPSHKWNHIQHVRKSDALIYFPIFSLLRKNQPWFNSPASEVVPRRKSQEALQLSSSKVSTLKLFFMGRSWNHKMTRIWILTCICVSVTFKWVIKFCSLIQLDYHSCLIPNQLSF